MLYQVWMEGARIQGGSFTAHKVGEIEASSFQEACDKLCDKHSTYDRVNLINWGCGLYDNETDARKNFG